MQFTKLGRSNMSVSRICLGTMHFGSYTPEDEAFRIMDKALEIGINFFDTANVYGGASGHGGSETIIGRWIKQGNRRDQIVLATKVYGNMADTEHPNEVRGISSYKVRRHAADSLRRLQTDRIDLYQVHHIDRTISLEEFWTTFGRLINDGDVLYMGTSNFPGWGLAKFQMHAWQQGQVGFVSEQPQYNLLNRYPELEVLPAAREFGIGVIPYMPLAGGLLTGKVKSVTGSRTEQVEHEYGMTVNTQQIADYVAFCQQLGETPHAVAIAWTLANPAVSAAIVGVRTVAHLDGLDRAAELQLAPEHMARLNEIFDINKGRPLRGSEAPYAFAW
ncbi:MAG: aldo/keto reductase [Chloroflexota bacterium]